MKEKMLSQGDLAALVGVSTATVWGWLNGSIPQRRTAEALCQKLDVSRAWLIKGHGHRHAYISGTGPLSVAEKQSIITTVLGLPSSASDSEITSAWRKHMMKKFGLFGLPEDASEDEIHEAYRNYRLAKVNSAGQKK